jgi:hypothetical protein
LNNILKDGENKTMLEPKEPIRPDIPKEPKEFVKIINEFEIYSFDLYDPLIPQLEDKVQQLRQFYVLDNYTDQQLLHKFKADNGVYSDDPVKFVIEFYVENKNYEKDLIKYGTEMRQYVLDMNRYIEDIQAHFKAKAEQTAFRCEEILTSIDKKYKQGLQNEF